MSKITKLYTNGCSFTYDNYIYRDLKSFAYGDILAKLYGTSYLNMALPGSCNRRIIRTTFRDALDFDSSTLVVIQLTILHRTEKAFTPGQNNEWKMDKNHSREEYHESIKDNEQEKINQEYYKTHIKFFDSRAELTNLAADLLMLTAYLQKQHIPYYVFNYQSLASNPSVNQIYDDRFQQQLRKDPRVMNILTDSLTTCLGKGDWYYDSSDITPGHLSPVGHARAAEILYQLISSSNQCN